VHVLPAGRHKVFAASIGKCRDDSTVYRASAAVCRNEVPGAYIPPHLRAMHVGDAF